VWATNFKHKLASGSPVMAVAPRFLDFFGRALRPGQQLLPLEAPSRPLRFCQSIVRGWCAGRLYPSRTLG